jgi:hypothetical protein
MLAGDLVAVEKRASELLAILVGQLHSEYRLVPIGSPKPDGGQEEKLALPHGEPSDMASLS